MFWILIELLVLIVVMAFFLTQLIIPLWQDRPLFPSFRKTRADNLEDEVNERLEDERHLKEVLEKKQELDRIADENLKSQLDVEGVSGLAQQTGEANGRNGNGAMKGEVKKEL